MKFFDTALSIEFAMVDFDENSADFDNDKENSVNFLENSQKISENSRNFDENSVNFFEKSTKNGENFNDKTTANPQKFTASKKVFLGEFQKLGTLNLSKWQQLAAKVDFSDGEELLFKMLLSIKGDLARLESKIDGENALLSLPCKDLIKAINFDGFKLAKALLRENAEYYARIELNRQIVGFFFKSSTAECGVITLMKNEDRQNYDKFVVEAQRTLINSAQKDTK